MEIISISAALLVVLVAVISTGLISKTLVPPAAHGRFFTIDGLRGYLAVFVFLHHSYIWYQYLRSGVWSVPESRLFVHFGQGGVALFFMITGFLFFSKILDSKDNGIDWLRLYVSRALRLTPLYVFSMLIMLSIVFFVSNGQFLEPISKVSIEALQWLTFTIFGNPDVNGLKKIFLITAGVSWSLPYEWFFYMALPVLAVLVGAKVPKPYMIISLLAIIAFGLYYLSEEYQWLFLGGMVAAVLVRFDRFTSFAKRKVSTFIVVILLAYIVARYPYLYTKTKPTYMLVVVFCLIAGGNSIFGLLSNRLSRSLGEMAYSIYLLHGILLYVVFKFVIGFSAAGKLTSAEHWLIIVLLTPILIVICGLTFRFIEKPSMQHTGRITAKLRSVFPHQELSAER